MEIFNKLKNAVTFSHYGNTKLFNEKIEIFSDAIKTNNEIMLKIVSDFRSSHMNIIAGMIAFIGFMNKDGIKDDTTLKYGMILLLMFIGFSIVSILLTFQYEVFVFRQKTLYMDKYLRKFVKRKQDVKTLEFDKEKAEKINKELKEYNPPQYKKMGYFVTGLFWITWLSLILGLYFITNYYIGIL